MASKTDVQTIAGSDGSLGHEHPAKAQESHENAFIEPKDDLCLYCRKVNNLVLCGPRRKDADFTKDSAQIKCIGPSIEQARRTAATCALCRAILKHIDNVLGLSANGDLERRIGLMMISSQGMQSDGLDSWQRDAPFSGAGVAGLCVFLEDSPGSCQWQSLVDVRYGLRVSAPKDCSSRLSGIVMRRQVDQEVSAATLQLARNWFDGCINHHARCNRTLTGQVIDDKQGEVVDLPTRVVFITESSWTVRETTGQRGRYAILSYCWGDAGAKGQFKLQKHNVHEFEREHPIDDSVPRTYRDAFTLARALGFQYLWIDALCIIQDDDSEWEREARAMVTIYQQATVTIAGLGNNDINDGLFARAAPSEIVEIPWLERTTQGDLHKMGHVIVSSDLPVVIPATGPPHDGLLLETKASKWATRGWTFQEAIVSRRTLFAGKYNFYWACQGRRCSEDGWDEKVVKENAINKLYGELKFADNGLAFVVEGLNDALDSMQIEATADPGDLQETSRLKAKTRKKLVVQRRIAKMLNSSISLGIAKGLQHFHDRRFRGLYTSGMALMGGIVAGYTRRQLTVPSDRMIAFEGFANIIARRTSQEFHSGLWTRAIAYCLYWCPLAGDASRNVALTAPSWSWASVSGEVRLAEDKNFDTNLMERAGYNGDMIRVTFMDENRRMIQGRGIRPESLQIEGYLASARRSTDTCVAYPETLKFFEESLLLRKRTGHHPRWYDTKSYPLFMECEAKDLGFLYDPETSKYSCAQCGRSICGLDELVVTAHLESCTGGVGPEPDASPTCVKLLGMALFDDPEDPPSRFKVLTLSHARDMGASWSKRKSVESSATPPVDDRQRVIHPSDESKLGISWTTGTGTNSFFGLRIYYLMLLRETEVPGQYVRIGIGVGYWLPGLDRFGGVEFCKKWRKSQVTIL